MLVERIHAGLLGGTGLTAMAAGLFLLAFLPEHPAPGDIVWRLVLCGAGFGLFQSPNNSILIASAPHERSGSASGMLATARLIGQTTGAVSYTHLLAQLAADEEEPDDEQRCDAQGEQPRVEPVRKPFDRSHQQAEGQGVHYGVAPVETARCV